MKTPHPATTLAQRQTLDRIGFGIPCPPIKWSVRQALLRRGLIRKNGEQIYAAEHLGPIMVPVYEMPPDVYADWLAHHAEKTTTDGSH